jgi:hypothetical protein
MELMRLLTVAIIGGIFANSCTPKKESAATSGTTTADETPSDGSDDSSDDDSGNDDNGNNNNNGSGGTVGGISITGTLNVDLSTVDTVMALPLSEGGEIGTFADASSSPIGAGGTLSLAIDDGGGQQALALRAWKNAPRQAPLESGKRNNEGNCTQNCGGNETSGVVVMAIKDGSDRFAAGESMQFIAMPVTADDSAMNLPIASLVGESLDLGAIAADSSGILAAAKAADASNFSLESDTLKSLAATDDPLRRVRNIYMNTDPETGVYFNQMPIFMIQGRLQAALSAGVPEVIWKDTGVTTWTNRYSGYVLSFTTNHPSLTVDSICGAGAGVLKLKVPDGEDPIAHESAPATTYSELTNTGATANGPDQCTSAGSAGLYYKDESVMNNGVNVRMSGFNWGGSVGFINRIPSGYWDISLDDEVLARFDLAASYPMDDSVTPARPIVYIPGLKITMDSGTRAFVSAEFKLYRWDRTLSSFVEQTDYTAVQLAAKNFTFGFADYSTSGASWTGQWEKGQTLAMTIPEAGESFTVTAAQFAKTWTFPAENQAGPDDDFASPSINSVVINYSMYGVGYMFDYRWANP